MPNSLRVVVSLCLLCAPVCLRAQATDEDALKLLDQVSAHYRDAEYLHLELETRDTMRSARYDQARTSSLSVYRAPGERFRYAADAYSGSATLVSDGTSEWVLLNSFPEWTKEPVGTYARTSHILASDYLALSEARDRPGSLERLASMVHAAHFQPDETIDQHGRQTLCAVVRFDVHDANGRQDPTANWQTVVWIDRERMAILRVERRSVSHYGLPPHMPQNGPALEGVQTTDVVVSDFYFEPHPDTFTFVPPPGAKQVDKLPSGITGTLPPSASKSAPSLVGKPLPALSVLDAKGADVPLTAAGHPLLIDVWATWCVPCLEEMPALHHIRQSTASTDLRIVGVDQDLHSSDAQDFLKRRGYDWQDFAYTVPFTKTVQLSGVPRLLLVDAAGTVVYDHTGADDAKGLAEAIAKLGPHFNSVKID